jgi:hypothetical protein
MYLEALIVSVDFSDYLAETLPYVLPQVDRLIVVTSPTDRSTVDVCRRYGADYLATDAFYHDGATFNKGRGINLGLRELRRIDWMVHLDADIVLPPGFRQALDTKTLDPHTLYGVRRAMCNSWREWKAYQPALPAPAPFTHERPVINRRRGYMPLGYLQLFHAHATALGDGTSWYAETSPNAAYSDLWFCERWTRRRLLTDLEVVHLYEGQAYDEINWRGRVSQPFGPS